MVAMATDSLEVMEVMPLRRGEEREVVTGVGYAGGRESDAKPHEVSVDVGPHEERAADDGRQVAEEHLEGVAIYGDDTHGGCPFVVLLVDCSVQGTPVY